MPPEKTPIFKEATVHLDDLEKVVRHLEALGETMTEVARSFS
jgi:hypothetical protein